MVHLSSLALSICFLSSPCSQLLYIHIFVFGHLILTREYITKIKHLVSDLFIFSIYLYFNFIIDLQPLKYILFVEYFGLIKYEHGSVSFKNIVSGETSSSGILFKGIILPKQRCDGENFFRTLISKWTFSLKLNFLEFPFFPVLKLKMILTEIYISSTKMFVKSFSGLPVSSVLLVLSNS